jgi:hypothetical protein
VGVCVLSVCVATVPLFCHNSVTVGLAQKYAEIYILLFVLPLPRHGLP